MAKKSNKNVSSANELETAKKELVSVINKELKTVVVRLKEKGIKVHNKLMNKFSVKDVDEALDLSEKHPTRIMVLGALLSVFDGLEESFTYTKVNNK